MGLLHQPPRGRRNGSLFPGDIWPDAGHRQFCDHSAHGSGRHLGLSSTTRQSSPNRAASDCDCDRQLPGHGACPGEDTEHCSNHCTGSLSRFREWFSHSIIGIIPLDRTGGTDTDVLFETCRQALDRNEILILFPENTRGDREHLNRIRKGICHLLADREQTPVIPVVMHGPGRALPRGEALLVPFNCDVVIGNPMQIEGRSNQFVKQLTETFNELFTHCLTRHEDDQDL